MGEQEQERDISFLPRSSLDRWVFLIGVVVVVGVYVFQTRSFWFYLNDDAYITFRFSRFLALGRGPYYNIGEHVEGYSNFLLMVGLAPVIRLFGAGAAPIVAKWVGVLSGVLGLALAWAIARVLSIRAGLAPWVATVTGILAAGLLVVDPDYAFNAVSGLETLLFAALLSVGVFLALMELDRDRWLGSGVVLAAAVLTRPEGIYLAGIVWLAQAIPALLARRLGWCSTP